MDLLDSELRIWRADSTDAAEICAHSSVSMVTTNSKVFAPLGRTLDDELTLERQAPEATVNGQHPISCFGAHQTGISKRRNGSTTAQPAPLRSGDYTFRRFQKLKFRSLDIGSYAASSDWCSRTL
jgi:hypothetical protein